MDVGGFGFVLMTVVGALLLLAVLAWGMLHNRRSPEQERESEQATRRVYDEEDAEHGHESDDMP